MDLIEKFKKTKDEYEAALKAFGEAMILVDRENKILYINKEAEEQLGFIPGEVIGEDWIEQTPATNLVSKIDPTTRPSAAAVMLAEVKSSIFILKNRESGKPILTNVIATPILLNGQVAGGIVVLKKSDFFNKPATN